MKGGKRLLDPHSARFLESIIRGLQDQESDRVLASILHSCSGIFGINGLYTIRGNGILAGHFIKTITRMLPKLAYVEILSLFLDGF